MLLPLKCHVLKNYFFISPKIANIFDGTNVLDLLISKPKQNNYNDLKKKKTDEKSIVMDRKS